MILVILTLLNFLIDQTPGIHQKLKTDQLVVVTTGGWNDIQGKMSTYQWKANKWSPVLVNIPIVTGRSGLAWGKGLHDPALNKGKLKREGDGNAPAGLFYLNGLSDIRLFPQI